MSKVVLITGASSGIGKSIATYLSKKKYKVYGTSRFEKNNTNVPFSFVTLDVTNVASIKKAIAKVIEKEGRIDVLINNAGRGITGAVEDTPTEEMKVNFDTNFFGPIEVIKAVLPQMRKQKRGLIINVTSIAGYMGLPFRGVYSASKGALELITETIRIEVKPFGIDVVAIAPGDFTTNIATGRYHTPVFKESAYKEVYKENLKMIDADVKKGMHPIEMAKAVYSIIETKNPKIHYKVGKFLEKKSILLKKVLPEKIYEKLLKTYYKL